MTTHVLVLFCRDKKTGIVDESAIYLQENQSLEPGETVVAQWGAKKYTATIIRVSSSRTYLEKLYVNPDTGEVTFPEDKKLKSKLNQMNEKQKKCSKENKILEKTKKAVQLNYERTLLSAATGNAEKKEKSHDNNNKKRINKDINTCFVEKDLPAQDAIKPDNMSLIVSVEHSNSESKKKSANEEFVEKERKPIFCELCGSLPVTPEVLMTFEHITGHLRLKLNSQSTNDEENVQDVPDSLNKLRVPEWKIPALGKIELVKNSGVWLKAGELEIIHAATKEPNELVRRLLILALTEKKMAQMCAMGTSENKQRIDDQLRETIKCYVEKLTGKKYKIRDYNRVINQKCLQLASKWGSVVQQKGKKPGTSERSGRNSKSGETVDQPVNQCSSIPQPVHRRKRKTESSDSECNEVNPPINAYSGMKKTKKQDDDLSFPLEIPVVPTSSEDSTSDSEEETPMKKRIKTSTSTEKQLRKSRVSASPTQYMLGKRSRSDSSPESDESYHTHQDKEKADYSGAKSKSERKQAPFSKKKTEKPSSPRARDTNDDLQNISHISPMPSEGKNPVGDDFTHKENLMPPASSHQVSSGNTLQPLSTASYQQWNYGFPHQQMSHQANYNYPPHSNSPFDSAFYQAPPAQNYNTNETPSTGLYDVRTTHGYWESH